MAKAKLVRIKNIKLANSMLSTAYGKYKFDAEGTVQVSEELANLLVNEASGFSIVEDEVEEKAPEKDEEKKSKD